MHIDPEQRQDFVERRGLEQQRLEQQQKIVRHLRTLPQEIRQPYDWTEFRRRARERAVSERTGAGARGAVRNRKYVAMAAVLVLFVVGAFAWTLVTRSGASESIEPEAVARNDIPASYPEGIEVRADVEERWLASFPSEPPVIRVGTRAAVAGLEDRIAQLDDVLSAARVEGAQSAKLALLEEQRARLVNSLVQVRYAETLVSESR